MALCCPSKLFFSVGLVFLLHFLLLCPRFISPSLLSCSLVSVALSSPASVDYLRVLLPMMFLRLLVIVSVLVSSWSSHSTVSLVLLVLRSMVTCSVGSNGAAVSSPGSLVTATAARRLASTG